jgi:ribosomal protein L21E
MRNKQELLEEARDSLTKAAKRMKKYADQSRRSLEFQVGDKVMLKLTPQMWKKLTSKRWHKGLVQRYDGPFKVVKRVGLVAYRLDLPERMKVHPTFHVSFLKPFHEDATQPERSKSHRAPVTTRTELDNVVEKILDHRVLGYSKMNRRTEYFVQWRGEKEDSWEKAETLWKYEAMIKEYRNSIPTRASASSSGGGLLHP